MKAIFKSLEALAANRLLGQISLLKTTKTFSDTPSIPPAQIDGYFTTLNNIKVPVLKHHRYSIKKCWLVFGPVAALSELYTRGLLEKRDHEYLKKVIGYRTITEPLPNIRECLSPYLKKYSDLFITTDVPDVGKRLLKPTLSETEALITKKMTQHKTLVEKVSQLPNAKQLEKGDCILEIGYTSGGESIIGFERLGFKGYGIDNFYYNSIQTTSRHDFIKQQVNSSIQLDNGDITTRTLYDDNFFSAIYSLSVLEHIADIPAAFREMYRVIKPGGFMFHRYDPFFHIAGAHSHGTLDSPWAHMRISDADTERYFREFRPLEANILLPLIKNGLNRNHTISFIQRSLAEVGFRIRLWETEPLKKERISLLTPDILTDCLASNKNVSIDDLVNKAVLFIAEKPY